jgi:septal ring factor EnvC (AmiA/AmiB activator)
MYTKGQARLFADNDSVKNLFLKNRVNDKELTSYKKEIEKIQEEMDKVKEERKGLQEQVKDRKNTISMVTTILEEFVEKVISYNKAIKNYNNLSDLHKAREELINALLFTEMLENDKVLKESNSEFINRILSLRAKLKKEDPYKTLERLNDSKEEEKYMEQKSCYQCNKQCEPYEGIKLKCNHIIDSNCLER